MQVTRTQDLITKRKLHSFDCFFTSLNYHHEKCVQTSNRNFTLDRPRVHWDHYRQRWKELSTPLVVWLRKESKYYETCSQGCQNKPATGAFHRLFWILRWLLRMLVSQFWAWYWRNKMEIAAFFLDGTSYSKTYWQPCTLSKNILKYIRSVLAGCYLAMKAQWHCVWCSGLQVRVLGSCVLGEEGLLWQLGQKQVLVEF